MGKVVARLPPRDRQHASKNKKNPKLNSNEYTPTSRGKLGPPKHIAPKSIVELPKEEYREPNHQVQV